MKNRRFLLPTVASALALVASACASGPSGNDDEIVIAVALQHDFRADGQLVADAPHERLEPIGIRLKGQEKGDGELWETWRQSDADAFADLAMLDAIVSKRSFAQVWGNDDDEPTVFNYSLDLEAPANECVDYVNTAEILETGQFVDVTGTFDAGVESLRAHGAYIDGLGWEHFDEREMLEGFGRMSGTRMGVDRKSVV